MTTSFKVRKQSKTFVKSPEELGLNVDAQGIYCMTEETWIEAMIATGKLQFGVGDTTSAYIRERMTTLSSSKDLEEQKFFIDAIAHPGYRDHELHPIIRQTFAYQVSERKDKREVFKVAIADAMIERYIASNDFEEIRQWVSNKLRGCASKLNPDHTKLAVSLREIQSTVLKKIVNSINKNGINTNILAELAPRLGKTILFLMVAKTLQEKFGHKAMFVMAYGVGLSVKTSYQEEVTRFQDFSNMVYIDNADNNAESLYQDAIASNKFPVVFVSLNAKIGDDETPERLDWIEKRTEDCIALLEETDFGNHTDSQVEKTTRMFGNKLVTQINASGTNIGRIAKAFGDNTVDEIISVPYCMVEQDGSIPNVVKRKFYNMMFNSKMNNLLEGFDEEYLPNMKKLLEDSLTQEKFITALFQDLFGYPGAMPYGLNLNRMAGEVIKHSMLFVNITKKGMRDLASVIETACDEHKVLILNGDETNNKDAQGRTFEELIKLENGAYPGKDKLIVITNMMGTRSYSIPQIQACLFMMDGGDVYPYMQRYSRCLTPGGNKQFGHIFDFAFDTSKTRNTEMSIAVEAAILAQQKGIDYPSAVREVLFSVNIRDMMSGGWISADEIIKRFEDNQKLQEVANAMSKMSIEDFSGTDFEELSELAKRVGTSKSEQSELEKIIATGKTYENKKQQGVETTDQEDKEYQKVLLQMKRAVERAIRALNESASTVTEFANYQGKTYEQCLEIISNSKTLRSEFVEVFGVSVDFVKNIKHKLQLNVLDMIVVNTINGMSKKNVTQSSLGIVADDPELWKEIFNTRSIRRTLNSNRCKNILVVAGGHGTEIDVLIELYGEDILEKIVYNEKYTYFCNSISKKYPTLKIVQGDFADAEFEMKFDLIVGNPPYGRDDRADKGNKVKSYKQNPWPVFTKKSLEMLNKDGILAFVTPKSWLAGTYDIREGRYKLIDAFKQMNLIYVNMSNALKEKYFKTVGTSISVFIVENSTYSGKTTIVTDYETKDIDFSTVDVLPPDPNPVLLSINSKTIYSNLEKFNFASVNFNSKDAKTDSQTKTKTHQVAGYCNGSDKGELKITYWKTADRYTGIRKVLLGKQDRSYLPFVDDKGLRIGQNQLWFMPLADNETKEAADSVFHSKLYKAMIMLNKHGAGPETVLAYNLPKVDLTKTWTFDTLCDHFNLTTEERDYILNNVK